MCIGDRWMTRLKDALQACYSPQSGKRLPIFPILLEEAQPESLSPFLELFQSVR